MTTMDTVTAMDTVYDMPNIGGLLGTAYNCEEMRLRTALQKDGVGITPAEYLILRILFAHKSIQQCEISRILGKDKASVSRSVQSLVRKGLAAAEQVSYRCSLVSLTYKGESLKPKIFGIAASLHEALSERISKQQLEILREILEKIIK